MLRSPHVPLQVRMPAPPGSLLPTRLALGTIPVLTRRAQGSVSQEHLPMFFLRLPMLGSFEGRGNLLVSTTWGHPHTDLQEAHGKGSGGSAEKPGNRLGLSVLSGLPALLGSPCMAPTPISTDTQISPVVRSHAVTSIFCTSGSGTPSVAFQLKQWRCHHTLIFLSAPELSSLLTPGAHTGMVLGMLVVSIGQVF